MLQMNVGNVLNKLMYSICHVLVGGHLHACKWPHEHMQNLMLPMCSPYDGVSLVQFWCQLDQVWSVMQGVLCVSVCVHSIDHYRCRGQYFCALIIYKCSLCSLGPLPLMARCRCARAGCGKRRKSLAGKVTRSLEGSLVANDQDFGSKCIYLCGCPTYPQCFCAPLCSLALILTLQVESFVISTPEAPVRPVLPFRSRDK